MFYGILEHSLSMSFVKFIPKYCIPCNTIGDRIVFLTHFWGVAYFQYMEIQLIFIY